MTHSGLSLPRHVPTVAGRIRPSGTRVSLLPPLPALLSLSLCFSRSVSLQENLRLFAEGKKKNIFLTLGALSNFGVCGRNRLTRMLARRLGPVSSAAELSSLWPCRRLQLHLNSWTALRRGLGNQRRRFMFLDVLHVLSFFNIPNSFVLGFYFVL